MTPPGIAVGIDVGGTRIAALLVDRAGRVVAREVRPTPAHDPDATLDAMVDEVRALLSDEVVAVGISAAGLIDHDGVMRFAPNLAWRDVPLAAHVEQAVHLPVVADNDNNAAAWGEFRFGAGRGAGHLLLVGVGTGIGGGIVLDGRLYHGATGFAAEIGHIVMQPDGPECGCGNRGCWEQMASGTSITRAGAAAVTRHPHSLLVGMSGGDPASVTGPMVTEAARAGDTASRGILVEAGHWLGLGIAGLVNVLDPDVVVVGGGASEAGDLLLAPIRDSFERHVEGPDRRPHVSIVQAQLANDAGAIGAAALAFELLDGSEHERTTA
ncbi:MAG: ROK family glucokinase [Actinomycetota bacterium]